jgi:hypothetical protein
MRCAVCGPHSAPAALTVSRSERGRAAIPARVFATLIRDHATERLGVIAGLGDWIRNTGLAACESGARSSTYASRSVTTDQTKDGEA